MPITINGRDVELPPDPRLSLLDLLRERLHLSGTKKGCNQGACGACTVLVDGERILSCLALAVQYEGRSVTSIEGLAADGTLHPLQRAFIDHDGYQCGYCTPGQICSAIGMADELERGLPSAVTADLTSDRITLTRDELRERMSGNLCRCGAHNGIVEAITEDILAGEPLACGGRSNDRRVQLRPHRGCSRCRMRLGGAGKPAKYFGGGTNLGGPDACRTIERTGLALLDVSAPAAAIERMLADGGLRDWRGGAQLAPLLRILSVRSHYPDAVARAVWQGAICADSQHGHRRRQYPAANALLLFLRQRPDRAATNATPAPGCDAIGGFNRIPCHFRNFTEHCIATHPSDMCVALAALDADGASARPIGHGERRVRIG